jgi:hypothetical protein
MRKFRLSFKNKKGVFFTMKRSKLTDQQIAFALQQAEQDISVGEIIRKVGISEQTFLSMEEKVWKNAAL